MLVDFDVRGQQRMDFTLDEVLLKISGSYFSWKQQKFKMSWWICLLQACNLSLQIFIFGWTISSNF